LLLIDDKNKIFNFGKTTVPKSRSWSQHAVNLFVASQGRRKFKFDELDPCSTISW